MKSPIGRVDPFQVDAGIVKLSFCLKTVVITLRDGQAQTKIEGNSMRASEKSASSLERFDTA